MLNNILKRKNMSIRQLSQKASVGYNYVYRLTHNKVNIENCSLGTAAKLAAALGLTIGEFYYEMQPSFLNFRSSLHHKIKDDERETILYIIASNMINDYMSHGNYVKGLYSLATLDYLCKKNNISIISDYDEYRTMSLKEPFYTNTLIKEISNDSEMCFIPEYAKYNIYEGDLYDAC